MSIATVCLGGTLVEKLHAIAAAGFGGVEIFELDLLACPLSPAAIRDLCAELGLRIDMLQPLRDIEAVTADELARNLRRARHKFELMNELGTDLILVCSNVGTASVNDDKVAAAQLAQLADLAAQFGVRLAYEALAWGKFVNTVAHSWRIVALADRPNLGLCVDSFHILSRESNGAGFDGVPGEKIFFCQLADAPRMHLDALSWSRHYRVFPGEGDFDLQDFVRRLLATGYQGPLSLEIFNDVFRQIDPRRSAVDALRSLTVLIDQVGVQKLPSAQEIERLTFVEVRTTGSEDFADLMQGLGFTYRGRHQRKNVHLWQQGEARVIVNLEEAVETAPLVRGLGVQVLDADLAAARAEALHVTELARSEAPGEAVLTAMQAPDATHIFFESGAQGEAYATDWAREFHATHRTVQVNPELGIECIDHVSIAQPFEFVDEAVLFYQSLLGLRREAGVDVADPHGLVRSHALRNDSGSVRLALNLMPTRLENQPTPQHIAFHTSDIFVAARTARSNGLEVLKIPANYYADLDARVGDSPLLTSARPSQSNTREIIPELQEFNILYDEDATGAFFHFYTGIVGQVGFEVVQRCSGYQGYGAVNAPIRRAAQHLAGHQHTRPKPNSANTTQDFNPVMTKEQS